MLRQLSKKLAQLLLVLGISCGIAAGQEEDSPELSLWKFERYTYLSYA